MTASLQHLITIDHPLVAAGVGGLAALAAKAVQRLPKLAASAPVRALCTAAREALREERRVAHRLFARRRELRILLFVLMSADVYLAAGVLIAYALAFSILLAAELTTLVDASMPAMAATAAFTLLSAWFAVRSLNVARWARLQARRAYPLPVRQWARAHPLF
ncbi:hypothetical protein [Longimicrobium sp.]|uniref:hypothetical protein n=1 Tax=Longimicrobium sp. TaxID=2029185 RepID=UPI002D03E2DF|nr:hypothetical protein [Longimicrobium sp.]HSU16728.1 hypothetical protein [Longimicrobium sp.]